MNWDYRASIFAACGRVARRWTGLALLLVCAVLMAHPHAQQALSGPDAGATIPFTIVGNSATDEGTERQWVAVLAERPIANTSNGYRPSFRLDASSQALASARYERAVEYRWDFGDGTGVISTGERPSVTHLYPDSGQFLMRAEAWSNGTRFAVAEKMVNVRNRPPRFPRVSAVEIDPARSLFELGAQATDVDGDALTYTWNFGDGETLVTDEWLVRHAYGSPGRYTVTVTITDDDGDSRDATRDVVVTGADASDTSTIESLEERPTDAVRTSIALRVDGATTFQFTGEIRPIAGIFLASRQPRRGCRFMFSAFDDAHLAHLNFIVDLERVVPDGARYTVDVPGVWLNLEPTAARYRHNKSLLSGAHGMDLGGLGEMLQGLPGVAGLTPQQRQTIAGAAGVEPDARERLPESPTPSRSPFGFDDGEHFRAAAGQAELTFIPYDRATGRIEATLNNASGRSPYRSVQLNGDFALDLESARRDGVMRYDECGSGDLTIEQVSPDDQETFVVGRRPNVTAYFSDRYDVATLNADTFQLTYPEPGHGNLAQVDVRVHRRDTSAWIKPEQDLLGGVRYTARIKTGEGGVLSRSGQPVPDENGTGWYTWSFTTRLDFVPRDDSAPGTDNIGCHVFQTVRDAPLIAGKPSVARIYANWTRHPEVHPDAQVDRFTAHVALRNGPQQLATGMKTFVRPDLWDAEGVDEAKADHTANLFFTPWKDMPASVEAVVTLPEDPGDAVPPVHFVKCPTPIWALAPTMTVQWFLINVNAWNAIDVEAEVRPWVESIMTSAEALAQQLFPVASVSFEYGGIMPFNPTNLRDRLNDLHLNCHVVVCGDAIMQYWQDSPIVSAIAGVDYDPAATMIIGILPGNPADPTANVQELRGGRMFQPVDVDGPARLVFALEDEAAYRERYVTGVVHEMGHALWLDHVPWIETEFQQNEAARVRNEAWANGNQPAFWYAGIEGFRIALDGSSGVNKSSTEGNEESAWLAPLMYPATLPAKDIFIARHHYLQLMDAWQAQGRIAKP